MVWNSTWAQFQGGPENSGYVAVRTAPAVQPSHSIPIQKRAHSSPVVDPRDGCICLAGTDGTIDKFRPDLTKKPTNGLFAVLPHWVGSTPAVDSAGKLYANFGDPTTPYRNSALVCYSYSPVGGLRWKYEPPTMAFGSESRHGFLLGSPKVWSSGGQTLVFTVVCYGAHYRTSYLVVFDQRGTKLAEAKIADGVFVDLHGSGLRTPKEPRSPSHGGHVGTGTAHSGGATISGIPLPDDAYTPEPSPCVFQDSEGPDRPLIVVTDGVAWIAGFRYSATAGLEGLWGAGEAYFTDGGLSEYTSSPAAFLNGLVAVGTAYGTVFLKDPATGEDLFQPDVGGSVNASPASFLRQIYVVERSGRLSMIDANGRVKKSVLIGDSMASVLVSGSYVHVAASDGISTYDFLLEEEVAKFKVDPNDGMGVSSMAVSPDGTLYACSEKTLYAFAPPL